MFQYLKDKTKGLKPNDQTYWNDRTADVCGTTITYQSFTVNSRRHNIYLFYIYFQHCIDVRSSAVTSSNVNKLTADAEGSR